MTWYHSTQIYHWNRFPNPNYNVFMSTGARDCEWSVGQCRVCGLEAVPDRHCPAPALTHTDGTPGDPAEVQGNGPEVHRLCHQGTIW